MSHGAGNRFKIYALFPECRVSMHVIWGFKQQSTVFAIGKSIIDRTSPIDIGAPSASDRAAAAIRPPEPARSTMRASWRN